MSRGSFSNSNSNQALAFQIYNETLNTGKNLGGTKTKVRWRFGWSDEEGEHDIEFVHSKLSGKRVSHTCSLQSFLILLFKSSTVLCFFSRHCLKMVGKLSRLLMFYH